MSRSVFTEFRFRLSGIIFPISGKTIVRYIDKLSEEELIIDRHGNKSLYLTDEGIAKAKEILEKYGIADWEK